MKRLVSVIIPIYNTELYIEKCIESLLFQTYPDIEIILVNDGSTDRSRDICMMYSKKYEYIYYLEQKNSGVAVARNNGLEFSNGDYIVFVDSDDYVDKSYIELLMEGQKQAELSMCGYYRVNETDDIIDSNLCGERTEKLYNSDVFIKYLFRCENFGYQGYLFNKMFRRSIIDNNKLRFKSQIAYNEDRLFVLSYLLVCSSVKYNDRPYYFYVQRKGSAMDINTEVPSIVQFTEFRAFQEMVDMLKKTHNKNYCYVEYEALNAMFSKYRYWQRREKKIGKQMARKWMRECISSRVICKRDKLITVLKYLLYIKN